MANRYKAIEDEHGYLTLYLYNDEVDPQNGIPVTLVNYNNIDWNELQKEAHNRLVQMVERNPSQYNGRKINELLVNIYRSLLARQLSIE